MKLEGLNGDIVMKLAENGVKSMDDFAGLATDEFSRSSRSRASAATRSKP